MTFARGPYGGYLEQVTVDYFTHSEYAGLRGTHTQVVADMPPDLQKQVQPWLHDTIPIRGVPTPPLMCELNCATLGAWGNYLGDAYNGGSIGPVEHRREVAERSTLTMGLVGAMDTAVRRRADPHTNYGVPTFFNGVHAALVNDREAAPVEGLPQDPQLAAFGLARYMHKRLGLDEVVSRRVAASADLVSLAAATTLQLNVLNLTDVEGYVGVARDLGEVAARMALRHTELADPSNQRREHGGRSIAMALGRIGGYVNHGSQILSAVTDHMPTYATAILLSEGGATRAALRTIRERQQDLISEAAKEGRTALVPGNRRQEGIFRMAVRLLDIKERVFAHRGSPWQIDQAMNKDPYWTAAR